ncbi:hypothetical protein D3C72_1740760 [compost metagenome]
MDCMLISEISVRCQNGGVLEHIAKGWISINLRVGMINRCAGDCQLVISYWNPLGIVIRISFAELLNIQKSGTHIMI